jgi:hypothetical protein
MKNNSASQPVEESIKPIGVGTAILLGHLIVNVPALLFILVGVGIGLGVMFLLATLPPPLPGLSYVLGIISAGMGILAGWLWWSFVVPRWRRWAHKNGTSADKLQKWAVLTGLVWSKGSIFEKTEFKLKD